MLLVSRLSHIRKIVPSCYFGRLKKSSSGKGWYVSSRILRDKNANDIGFCGSIYDKDYGYLKWWTVCIFWIKSFRGEDCDIGADIYIYIFLYNETFLSFHGEDCDIGNTGCSVRFATFDSEHRQFWIPFHGENCNALCSFAYFSQTYCEIVIRYAETLRIFKSENREQYRILFLQSRLRYYERYHGLCFEVKCIHRKVKFTI